MIKQKWKKRLSLVFLLFSALSLTGLLPLTGCTLDEVDTGTRYSSSNSVEMEENQQEEEEQQKEDQQENHQEASETITDATEDENNKEESEKLQESQEAKEPQELEENSNLSEANLTDITEDGKYNTRDEVATYLHLYGHLPDNYITKNKARDLGWDSSAGNLWDVADGMSIGGDKFGNYEGLLPEAEGRVWRECDIGYEGGYRGAERILYSNDGLIYYTDDHYKSFTCLYGE